MTPNQNLIIKIMILICIITIIINYALHIQIINQDKALKESAINYVSKNCYQQQTNEWVSQNNLTLPKWNITLKT